MKTRQTLLSKSHRVLASISRLIHARIASTSARDGVVSSSHSQQLPLLQLTLIALAATNTVCLMFLLLLPPMATAIAPQIPLLLAGNTLGAALIFVILRHHNQVERIKQAKLRSREEWLRQALDAARVGAWDWDILADMVVVSEQTARLYGLSVNALPIPLATYLERLHPDDCAVVKSNLAEFLASDRCDHQATYRVIWPDRSIHWIEEQGCVERDITGRPLRMIGTVLDVSERKEAEAALRTSEDRYRIISELVSDYAFAYQLDDEGGAVLEWVTDAMTRILGYLPDEMHTALDSQQVIYPDDLPIALQRRQRLRAGLPDVSEYRMVAKDGRILWLRAYGRPVWDAVAGRVVRVFGAVQDITHIKQLEQQLAQAQKLEAIGRLTGGIAHDFNNLLTVILGNAQFALDTSTDVQALREYVSDIQYAAQRAASLTRQLLTFSRRHVVEARLLDLNTVVDNTAQLLRRLIGEDIKLVLRLSPELWQVKADPGQIEQVIMNLVVNGRDSMPMGGALTITTTNIDAYKIPGNIGTACTSYVAMAVRDTGVGMDAATCANIFEPFFTTKAPGKGTGLGLATVHTIVTESGGRVVVESAPGQGSTFTIYLPRADATGEPSTADASAWQIRDGDHTILIVEDEPHVRQLTGRMLRMYGYHVLEAADGPMALQLSATYTGTIDLLLADMIMPGGFNGCQVAERITAERPAIKVLYVSGYTDTAMTQRLVGNGHAVVMKPFTSDDLVRAVRTRLQS